MAFNGLHVIWTTHKTWQPHDARGGWPGLFKLYRQLEQNGYRYELSASLPQGVSSVEPHDAIALSFDEQKEVEHYLFELMAPDSDRIAGGLPIRCCAVTSTVVQLLFTPKLESHNQIIGRLKSKTAGQLLWSPARKGQKHIWSRGYWFASIDGVEAIAEVERFIQEQHLKDTET